MGRGGVIVRLLTSGLLMTNALFASMYEWIDGDSWSDPSLKEFEKPIQTGGFYFEHDDGYFTEPRNWDFQHQTVFDQKPEQQRQRKHKP